MQMNSKQKEVLRTGGLLVVLMCLFPPWIYFDNNCSCKIPAGRHFVLSPPSVEPLQQMFGAREEYPIYVFVDRFWLTLQLLVAIPLFVGAAFLLSDKPSRVAIAFGVLSVACAFLMLCFVVWLETL